MGVDVAKAALAAGQGVVATGRNTGTVTAIPGAKPRLVQVAGRANVLNLDVIPYVAFTPTHALALRHATEARFWCGSCRPMTANLTDRQRTNDLLLR